MGRGEQGALRGTFGNTAGTAWQYCLGSRYGHPTHLALVCGNCGTRPDSRRARTLPVQARAWHRARSATPDERSRACGAQALRREPINVAGAGPREFTPREREATRCPQRSLGNTAGQFRQYCQRSAKDTTSPLSRVTRHPERAGVFREPPLRPNVYRTLAFEPPCASCYGTARKHSRLADPRAGKPADRDSFETRRRPSGFYAASATIPPRCRHCDTSPVTFPDRHSIGSATTR